jgi:ribonuclease R
MRYSGKVLEILERAQNKFVGTLLKETIGWIVQPDGTGFVEPISVDDVGAKGARKKDKVVVEILSYPTERYLARGVIVEVLGRAGRYESEIRSIIRQYHLSDEFEDDCIDQARRAADEFDSEQIGTRDDITKKVIITIDPPDAKDFDDAISLEKDSDGNRVLGVHIADVSCFMPPDSPLDAEARIRGNSVYLPEKTIPMLPEILSNGICSLQPDQTRFVKSVYLTYDNNGKVLSRRFANSVICSRQRLTYKQADKALGGRTKGIKPEVVELLKNMEGLSRIIEKRRLKNGMMHLDLSETALVMDKSGRVVDAHSADDSYPHTMIEMFMVEANEAVASLLDRHNIALMRRIHPEPDSLSMQNLSKLVRALGYSLPRTPDRSSIQELLNAVRGTDISLAVNLVVLRSFEKAQYAPLHIGHFALASDHYCHFTSPIRRYADLLVHRVLQCHLQKRLESASSNQILAEQDLVEIGKHITFTEQRAEDAERELKTVLLLQMLSDRIGDELDCVVTGLAGFGVFIQSRKFGIEGLIAMDNLGPDKWKFNSKTQSIVGLNSGTSVHLGRAMKVRIVSVNVPGRKLDVCPVEPLAKAPVRRRKKKAARRPKKPRTRKRPRGRR